MKMGIRGKLLLPALLILLIFPIASYWAFEQVAKSYVREIAKREIAKTLKSVSDIASEVFATAETAQSATLLSKEFFGRLRSGSANQAMDAQVITVNSKISRTYPRSVTDGSDVREVFAHFQPLLKAAPEAIATGVMSPFWLDGREYFAVVSTLGKDAPDKTKYIITYTKVYDTGTLLSAAGQLVLFITGALALCTLFLIYLSSISISRPIDRLSLCARGARGGTLSQVEGDSDVREISELIGAFNDMSGRLARYDAEQRAFFQNVSHELRTPLMSIRGYAEGIVSGVFDDDSAVAGIIMEESSRLNAMVGELLMMTKLDGAQIYAELREIKLWPFVAGSIKLLEGLSLGRNIALHVEGESREEILVMADEELLSRAFSNVVSNCVRHAKKNVGVTIRRSENRVSIIVMDDGPGLGKEEGEHLFERFYKGQGGSTGLGLAIAKSAMEHMNGGIEARNGENGAVFELFFTL